jgi:starvation-inducible DNA-binding protein
MNAPDPPATGPDAAAEARAQARLEARLEEALEESFPASDVPAVHGLNPWPLTAPERLPEHFASTATRMTTMAKAPPRTPDELRSRRLMPLATPSDVAVAASKDIAATLNVMLANVFGLYLKTKNFHWHVSGPHFRDYHLLLDEQADQLFAMTDPIAERVRKLGHRTLGSIGQIARTQRLLDNDADYVDPIDMLAELREDNATLAAHLREAHGLCEDCGDVATASLIEVWTDETERRSWFLYETSRRGDPTGH